MCIIKYNVFMADILGEKKICNKCGKCCRLISSMKSYEELCADAKKGDSVAVNFLKLFLPYETQEEALSVDAQVVQEIIERNKKVFDTQTYFYRCRYINAESECMAYGMRPKLCRQYPKNEFVPLPSGCAYDGYSFAAREKVKAKVRRAKEQLLELKVMRENSTERAMLEKLNKMEQKLQALVESYKALGSYDW